MIWCGAVEAEGRACFLLSKDKLEKNAKRTRYLINRSWKDGGTRPVQDWTCSGLLGTIYWFGGAVVRKSCGTEPVCKQDFFFNCRKIDWKENIEIQSTSATRLVLQLVRRDLFFVRSFLVGNNQFVCTIGKRTSIVLDLIGWELYTTCL